MFIDYLDTPLGLFEFMATELGICQAIFCGDKAGGDKRTGIEKSASKTNEITDLCKRQLTEYFNGTRQEFTVPLDPQGTPFQQSVWDCLAKIPFGTVQSYGDIAKALNKPKASQAVGGANGRNPITLIVPCHRVIGSNGSLTGYAGGVARKLWLLKHEGVNVKVSDDDAKLNINDVIDKRQAKTEFLR
ncbi:methylated-DNA--[protein]-cysteine S-methyltransferase [Colwellia piezophila]|uniref:methylated-DNA--[protein]-cysteine S-methyltransferase n=1 Tax=Colwellia piezophila TaxID=211668 RepID=UPI000370B6EC|nr:methylated-DNA--[protein]-cysteine S-methyltransferase [Colwellia piezophila]